MRDDVRPIPSDSRAAVVGGRAGPLWALAAVAASTAICWVTQPWLHVAEQAMVYLIGVLVAASRLSRRDSVLAALGSVLALDYFFVPPYLGFIPTDVRDVLTLVTFLATSLVVSGYAGRVRRQAEAARERERRTAALYAFSRALSAEPGVQDIAATAVRHVNDLLGVEAVVFRAGDALGPVAVAGADAALARSEDERRTARWVMEAGRPAGRGTDSFPAAAGLHLPLLGPSGVRGTLSVAAEPGAPPLEPAQRRLLETLAALTAVALERTVLAEEAERARVAVETERTRTTLLSGLSHDLRTPLASITGAAGALLAPGTGLSPDARRGLLVSIRDGGDRLGRFVANLLDLTRVESGGAVAHKEWCPVEEIVTSALERLHARLEGRRVNLDLPEDVLSVRVDGVLFEQVVVNLLENAAKHTPAGTPIDVRVRPAADTVEFEVADRGAGIPPGEESRVFERFQSLPSHSGEEGTGLGLALCRAIVDAHGGRIGVERRAGGGAVFRVSIPREAEPVLEHEEEGQGAEVSP